MTTRLKKAEREYKTCNTCIDRDNEDCSRCDSCLDDINIDWLGHEFNENWREGLDAFSISFLERCIKLSAGIGVDDE